MPSLQTIFFAATAALAGFASAAPTFGSDSSLVAHCACDTVPSILDNVKAQVAAVNVDLSQCTHFLFSLSRNLHMLMT